MPASCRLPVIVRVAAVLILALPELAVAQMAPWRDPVFDDPLPAPAKPYEPPVRPAPFVPPPAAPMFQPSFPASRPLTAPNGPALPVMGTVCVVPAARARPVIRCDVARVRVSSRCACDGLAGRVHVR